MSGFLSAFTDYFRAMGKNTTSMPFTSVGTPKLVKADIKEPSNNPDGPRRKEYGEKIINNLPNKELNSLLKQTIFHVDHRRKMMKALYQLRGNDVVQTIMDVVIDDGLVSSNDNKIFTIKYAGETEKEEIQDILDKFLTKHKLDRTVLDFIDEALLYGEYMLPIYHEKGRGVYKLLDNADMVDMMAVYQGQDKVCFLHQKKNTIEEYPADSHIHFVLSHRKIRVEVPSYTLSDDSYTLPQYLKVGKSIIFPVINKLKQLEILEMANLALDLKKILAPVVVMVGMPDNTQTKDIGEIVETYQGLLKSSTKNMARGGDLKMEDILQICGEVVVLPSIGNTKGSIQTLAIDSEKESNSDKEEQLRKSIALTIGLPFYYLSLQGENGMSRLESLKLFARYSRKLNALQDCIIDGVRELLQLHLSDLGFIVDADDILIEMRQITNVELLDSMEYLVALTQAINDLLGIINMLNDNPNIDIGVDSEKLLEFLNKLFSEFPGCENLLIHKVKNDENTKPDPDNNGNSNNSTDNSFNSFTGYRTNKNGITELAKKLAEEMRKNDKNTK
jgi:hypothetical protein